jgi:hypothetical protein
MTEAMPPLPDPDDSEAVFEFAMLFNGYERFGSFEACAEAAKAKRRETLDDLRNELFFEARASRHRQDEDFVEVYRDLLPLLRSLS